MSYLVQCVVLFHIRLTMLVATTVALIGIATPNLQSVSPLGSPLVAFHRIEYMVLPLLSFGWLALWGASRALRRDRERRRS